jgi:spore photoproduct lyase
MTEFSLQQIDRIYIDRQSLIDAEKSQSQRLRNMLERIYSRWLPEQISVVDEEPRDGEKGTLSAEQFDRSKKELLITPFRGQFFKRCPGARPGLTCCNYFVLNLGQQCNMNCSYCYLQSFINSPVMKIYSNLDAALQELKDMSRTLFDQPLRVGTGEVIDSLSLDELTLYSRDLIEFFKNNPRWKLEFKTKSSKVDQFLDVAHAGNVIVSFSLNPQNIIESEEHGTASLKGRLQAARKARDKGFLVAFHLDPMIYHEGWRDSYASMVDEICGSFRPEDVNVMSVGALRFQPEQRHLMRERFGLSSLVMQGEMFQNRDGKLRYDQSVREEMFQFITQQFKTRSPQWNIFLCMETPEAWLGSMGSMPKSHHGLSELFDHNVIRLHERQ